MVTKAKEYPVEERVVWLCEAVCDRGNGGGRGIKVVGALVLELEEELVVKVVK